MAKKRRAKRVYFDKENEANLPARRTKEIAYTHLESERTDYKSKLEIFKNDLEKNENGKEVFDHILNEMSTPKILPD